MGHMELSCGKELQKRWRTLRRESKSSQRMVHQYPFRVMFGWRATLELPVPGYSLISLQQKRPISDYWHRKLEENTTIFHWGETCRIGKPITTWYCWIYQANIHFREEDGIGWEKENGEHHIVKSYNEILAKERVDLVLQL